MDQVNLKASARSRTGKGSARAARREGRIPAIVYSRHTDAMAIALDPIALRKAIKASERKFNTLLTLDLDDGGHKVALLKDWQVDPVSRQLLHADFLEVKMDEKLEAQVPVELVGRPVGVVDGGVLSQIRRDVTVRCLPNQIPVRLDVDVSGMKINQSLHVADVPVPENVELVYQKNFTIAVVSPPEAGEAVAAAATAPEPGAAPAAEQATPESGE